MTTNAFQSQPGVSPALGMLRTKTPWRSKLSEFSLGAGLLSSLARVEALLEKVVIVPFGGAAQGPEPSRQDIGALVCSAVFAREYLPRCVWVEVKQSKVRAPHHLPSPAASICSASKARSRQPVLHRAGGDTWILPLSPWERS